VTGYLQRLVTTAVQGKTGVHPIVRPPGNGPDAGEPAWTEFADQVDLHPGEGLAPAGSTAAGEAAAVPVATPAPDGPAPAKDRPPPAAGHVRDRTAAEPSRLPEIMTLLFGETPAVDPGTPVPVARSGSIARPPVARRSRPGQPADHPSGPAREHSTPAAPTRSGLQPAAAWPGAASLPPFGPEPQRWARPAASGRAEGADGGDVEIHIGRIEVTAVSAAPAAPDAKAARKSINLSEYLRNGR
jgi:hypothetical protein